MPYLDKVAHKVSILERQLKEFTISVITSDNVEVSLNSTVFYRVTDASRSVYRIKDIDSALKTADNIYSDPSRKTRFRRLAVK